MDCWNFRRTKVTPGPGAYCTQSHSPSQKRSTSSSRLNSSTCSSSSTVSGGGVFLSPPKHTRLSRSASAKSVHGRLGDRDPRGDELQDQIQELTQERDRMKVLIGQLEDQLETLKTRIATSEINGTEYENLKKEKSELELEISKLHESEEEVLQLKQQNEEFKALLENSNGDKGEEITKLNDQIQLTRKELTESQHMISRLTDERSGLQLKLKQLEESAEQKSLTEDEVQNLKEQIEHLTLLRDNLEASVMVKDDLIAELQLQLDEVVVEGQSFHDQMEVYKAKVEQLEEEVQNSFIERDDAEHRVRNIVAKYEAMIKDQMEEREMNQEMLAKKDIEIELLNGSLANLNLKVTEYEHTISSLQVEVSQRKSKISCLETTVSDLSMMTKEKEFMESMLEEELNQRAQEVNKLEQSIREVETKLDEVNKEKESVAATLEAERKRTAELNDRIQHLEVQIKEKEVVQQFLEKEIASREAEVSESSSKIKNLEEDLETARQVALDLQQDAEVQLNQVLTLKATISAKDYDIEAKEELITTLKNEVSQKLNETSILQGQVEQQTSVTTKTEDQLKAKETQILNLDEELTSVKAALQSREESLANLESKATQLEDNNHQLEEKVVELMAEISDREAEHIARVNRIQDDLDDLGIKYSESLLEHEATRRALTQTSEELERENLLRMASERDIQTLKEELGHYKEEHKTMELNLKDLVQKYTNLEDALACEEAENRDLEDRLEREAKNAQEAAATAEKEISSLQTSNEGFCTQITQLKIDMRKKSQAVVEMQHCIEALREEKQHLTTLRDNLETTVETKEDCIAQLHLQASTLEREMEEERVTLRSRIADLENHLKETEEHLTNYKTKVTDLEDQVSYLEDEKLKLTKSYEKQLEEKSSSVTQAATELVELKKTYEGYEDQLKNLQTSLVEKTNEVDSLKEKYSVASRTVESQQEEIKALETSLGRSKQDVEGMNKTLSSKDSMLDDLNTTLGSKREEIQSLYKSLEEKQSALVKCESRIQQLEENEEKLAQDKEEAVLTISSLKESLDNTKKRLSRLEIVHKEEKEAEVSRVTSTLEGDIKELKDTNAELLEELNSWKNKFQHLEKMIEPFREQLDAYEVEKVSLLSRSSAAKEEVDKLSKQYATLLGHQNHKQKIQHVLKLKTENNELREEVFKLRQETERQRKTVKRLEEKMLRLSGSTSRLNDTSRMGDKENSFYAGAGGPAMSSTPLKPSNKPQRL
ncbi:myosin-13-like isoform X2 [Penaeus japonicus]|uniref:myosin-13-like isoform X2 n=1 Tax=Penaeus japonicus TaxID=27405 RepID=UPI001C70F564|nr:myosin-13-like isoform X2 [Penaeus japonicus]